MGASQLLEQLPLSGCEFPGDLDCDDHEMGSFVFGVSLLETLACQLDFIAALRPLGDSHRPGLPVYRIHFYFCPQNSLSYYNSTSARGIDTVLVTSKPSLLNFGLAFTVILMMRSPHSLSSLQLPLPATLIVAPFVTPFGIVTLWMLYFCSIPWPLQRVQISFITVPSPSHVPQAILNINPPCL